MFSSASYILNTFTTAEAEAETNGTLSLSANDQPKQFISKAMCLYTFATQGYHLELYQACTEAYQLLLQLKIPMKWRNTIDIQCLMLKAKPLSNSSEIQIMCYRCSNINPLIQFNKGDQCMICQHPYIRDLITFEILPLVEFDVAQLTYQQVIDLLEMDYVKEEESEKVKVNTTEQQGNEGSVEGAVTSSKGHQDQYSHEINIMSITNDDDDDDHLHQEHDIDPFQQILLSSQDIFSATTYQKIQLDSATLSQMNRNEVLIQYDSHSNQYQYFKNTFYKDFPIIMCKKCQNFFSESEYELYVLQNGSCPICKYIPEDLIDTSTSKDQQADDDVKVDIQQGTKEIAKNKPRTSILDQSFSMY